MEINENKKKKYSIYVEPKKYKDLKKILGAMDVSLTDFFDTMITDFISNMEVVVRSNDKDELLKSMMSQVQNIDSLLKDEIQENNK